MRPSVCSSSAGTPIGECLAAYRLAITLNPQNPSLKLNLAQLLFIKGDEWEASRQLQEALTLGLDESAQLEAQFYQLAHTSVDPAEILRSTSDCLSRGARLHWNVASNIEKIRQVQPERANLLST